MGDLLTEVGRLRDENAALKDEVARLKGHKGRPKLKPSGMDKSTERRQGAARRKKGRLVRPKPAVTEEHKLSITPPPGSRFKGYEDFTAYELHLEARVIRYRRERWVTPEGKTLIAPLPKGLRGHLGPELVRFVMMQHHQAQVTMGRIAVLLQSLGLPIAKSRLVEQLNGQVETFKSEALSVFRAGLLSSTWFSVDDTGARHRAKNGVTTQIGDDRFTFFASTSSKSRTNFLEVLRAGHDDYVINPPALAYMRKHNLSRPVIDLLAGQADQVFADQAAWLAHLDRLGITRLEVHPDPVKIATQGALWGSLHHHGLLDDNKVILSDDAGQFRIGNHALCWIHAERLVHKLVGRNDQQRQAIDRVRRLIWGFYANLKAYQRAPSRRRAVQLRVRFDQIFALKTDFVALDRLLARLRERKDELLRVLDHPEIPLHTNGSERDIRCHVTKRKISGGTWSDDGREARDRFLSLYKTCQKLKVSFFDYLGDRLGVQGAPSIVPLPDLVIAAKA
ncbi:MAG: transposase [Alphaproteobacteria bacterium]|nr:transposase [Alphaproteobacteria bacterium]